MFGKVNNLPLNNVSLIYHLPSFCSSVKLPRLSKLFSHCKPKPKREAILFLFYHNKFLFVKRSRTGSLSVLLRLRGVELKSDQTYICCFSRNLVTIYRKYYKLIGYRTRYLSGDGVCVMLTIVIQNGVPFPLFKRFSRKRN